MLTEQKDSVERAMFGFRLREGVDLGNFQAAPELFSKWKTTLEGLADEGLVEYRNGRWFATKPGGNMADHVAEELL